MPQRIDSSVLEMALVGCKAELQKIVGAMNAISKELGVRRNGATAPTISDRAKPKRVMSPAARRRIAAAQKKRWAAFHAKQKAPAKAAKKTTAKKKLSPARKAALVANLAKARAAKAAKKPAAAATA
jgi:hypothetical protein